MKPLQTKTQNNSSNPVDFPSVLENVEEIEAWVKETRANYGQIGLCERITDLLRGVQFTEGIHGFSVDRLDAVLSLNLLSNKEHLLDSSQYLTQPYMPYALASALRSSLLAYADAFAQAYAAFSSAGTLNNIGSDKTKLALIFARQMYYLCEHAKLQMYNYSLPKKDFWKTVNSLYAKAESLAIETIPIHLFAASGQITTIQDQFLILMMLIQLSQGNLSAKQLNSANLILSHLSAHIEIQKEHNIAVSFAVDLQEAKPAWRLLDDDKNLEHKKSVLYWDSSDLVIELSNWSVDVDSGKKPEPLKLDCCGVPSAEFLRFLCREWASQPVPLTRSERVETLEIPVSVVSGFPFIHQCFRQQAALANATKNETNFNEAAIYNKKNKIYFSKKTNTSSAEKVRNWILRDKSETGIGFCINDHELASISLKTLFAYREQDNQQWSVGLVRRIRRDLDNNTVILGAEQLSSQLLPVSLHQSPKGKLPENLSSSKWHWEEGLIGLFSPIKKDGKTVSGLFLPSSLYGIGKTFLMSAKGQEFHVVISRLLEHGTDWCLVETKRTNT